MRSILFPLMFFPFIKMDQKDQPKSSSQDTLAKIQGNSSSSNAGSALLGQ